MSSGNLVGCLTKNATLVLSMYSCLDRYACIGNIFDLPACLAFFCLCLQLCMFIYSAFFLRPVDPTDKKVLKTYACFHRPMFYYHFGILNVTRSQFICLDYKESKKRAWKLFTYAQNTTQQHSLVRVIYKYYIASLQHHRPSGTCYLPVIWAPANSCELQRLHYNASDMY